jgi:hypothetical protein
VTGSEIFLGRRSDALSMTWLSAPSSNFRPSPYRRLKEFPEQVDIKSGGLSIEGKTSPRWIRKLIFS